MPVGTQGTVKGVDPGRLRDTGAQMILANTYHLALRPGEETVAALGGLHAFMGWDGPILTDSGGFQVFSLADRMTIDEQGVAFRSHIDGALVELTPERAVAIQEQLGSDVAMVLDHVVGAAQRRASVVADAMRRSVRWAERCQAAATRPDQALFAIVQGGLDPSCVPNRPSGSWRIEFRGYAIGGLSVGESPAEMYAARRHDRARCCRTIKPRYLMGVGRPSDLARSDRPRHRPVRLRDADAQRPQRAGVHRRRPGAAAQPAARPRPPAARSRLPLPGLPTQPRLPAAPVPGRRDARARCWSRSTTSPTTSGCWPRPGRRSPKTASRHSWRSGVAVGRLRRNDEFPNDE